MPAHRQAAIPPVLVQSFSQWRTAARALLARQQPPQALQWTSDPHGAGRPLAAGRATPRLRIPRHVLAVLARAACCRVPNRWAFLYLVLWRWQHGEHAVLSPADPDGATLHAMLAAVRAAERQMLAAIRFRERRTDAGPPRFVAWFDPSHDVLPQVAARFAAQLGGVSWMIATPAACVMWDGAALHHIGPLLCGPGEDAGDSVWGHYCRSVYTPARLHADLLAPARPQAR